MTGATLSTAAPLALLGMALTLAPVTAQDGAPGGKTRFAPPQVLAGAEGSLGAKRLYPSPILYDIDRDGRREMLLGGLRGFVSLVRRTDKGWGKEVRIKATDGKDLKFHNW